MNRFLFTLLAVVVPITVWAQQPAQITLEPLTAGEADLLVENEQLRQQITDLKNRIQMAEGLLRATFVAQNPRGQLAAFQTTSPAHYQLTSLVPSKERRIFLPLLKKHRLSIVSDTTGIVDASQDHSLETAVADQELISRLDDVWKSQRFIDVPPEGSLKGLILHSSNGIDDFGVVTSSNGTGVTYVNWDGFTKSLPIDDHRIKSGYTGDLQEFIREVPSVDFVSYAALMIAHKLGHANGQRGNVNLAIHIEIKDMGDTEQAVNSFSAGINFLNASIAALSGKGSVPSSAPKGLNLEAIVARLKDELYTRLVRLGVPVVEREAIQQIVDERSKSKRPEFADLDYEGLLTASHIAYFTVSKATSFGPYHVEVRLLDCHRGHVVWSDGRDRIDPSQRPAFMKPPSSIRIAPRKLVRLSYDRSKLTALMSDLKVPSSQQRQYQYSHFPSNAWYLGSNNGNMLIAKPTTTEIIEIPLAVLNTARCETVSRSRIKAYSSLTMSEVASMMMARVGKIDSVDKTGTRARVVFADDHLPAVGAEICPVLNRMSRPFSVAQIGAPNAKVVSVSAKTCTISREDWDFRSLDPNHKVPGFKTNELICFAEGDHLGAQIVPLNALGGLVGRDQREIELEILHSLRGQPFGQTVVLPRTVNVEVPTQVDPELDLMMMEMSLPMGMSPREADDASAEIAREIGRIRGFNANGTFKHYVIPLVNCVVKAYKSGRRTRYSVKETVVFVRYDPAARRATPVFRDGREFDLL